MQRFEGRTAIVTGASRGIGLAIARRLVDEGARVCITARKAETLEEAVASINAPGRVFAVAGKADDPDHQGAAVSLALEQFGSLDVLVNNAGINPVAGSILDTDVAAANKIVGVNCLGALAWVRAAHQAWMADNGGAVVNVSSVAGLRAAQGIGLYGGSKAMLNHLTQQLAMELGPRVRVNGVAPAVVKTKFGAPLYEGREEEVVRDYPLGRLGTPEDIAGAVAFLASDDAGWITGQTLVADGGLTITGGV